MEFAYPYIKQICDAINEVPITVFAKGAYSVLSQFGQLNCETIGLDWNMDIRQARNAIGPNKTLQGNLDPCILYADKDTIRRETRKMLMHFGPGKHIANLGHGVYPDTNPDHVKIYIDTVKEFVYSGGC